MSLYSSRAPRDLNHDPFPFVTPSGRKPPGYIGTGREWVAFSPRPEFDHEQHNEPNPILLAFRRDVEINTGIGAGSMAAEWYERGLLLFEAERATFAHADHARKVPTRLARLIE